MPLSFGLPRSSVRIYDEVVKPPEIDTQNPTLDEKVTDADPGSAPGWRFYVLYASSVGILEGEAQLWNRLGDLGIGRRSTSPTSSPWLHIPDERVSREHARLRRVTEGIAVQDLHSRNGTSVNGDRLPPGQQQQLRDGDVLRVGDAFILVRHEPELADVPIPWFVGQSRAARLIRHALMRATRTERALLLLGETGTGKEVAAQALHRLSRRRGKLVAVNCAAVPAPLVESHFFGVRRGAFTDAIEQSGAFIEADQGTLFLDEVGELPLDLQPKLLRALETREVIPVGSQRPVPCNVRVVAATNRDLGLAMRSQQFREDLYARLAGEVLRIPPLRERREDVLLLARHFVGADFRPSPRLVAALLAHSWPFNIRELGNVLGSLTSGGEDDVLRALNTPVPLPAISPPIPDPEPIALSRSTVPSPSREQLHELLSLYGGNLRRLEIERGYSRRQVHRWVESHGLDLESYRRRT